MPITMDGVPLDQEPVGAVLAQMRRAQRLTGAELADMVGMSQPKISRIERGRGLPDPEDIGAIARALGADDRLVRSLMERAERSHDRMTDWRPTSAGLASRQESMADWEAAAEVIRDFQPAVLGGLLQTSGYARAALLSFQRLVTTADDSVETAILSAVTARIRRQEILADPAKSFRFVLTEAVLRNRLCPPAEMLAQIAHLRELSTRPNVHLAVIEEGVPVDLPPLHGFTLLDDTLVVIDVYNTGLITRGRNDVGRYRQVFDLFRSNATEEVHPLLDKYEAHYIDQLRSRSTDQP
ncbi:helix-turn-helix domain-containing protein [Actinoplanes sp. GCM10030250]|uniref:helix-turn-helix domain-containing protein n=1 Tax=Actinoplanes sp. GCM10030250 TaxID=3273376 RepID=UPI00360EA3C2